MMTGRPHCTECVAELTRNHGIGCCDSRTRSAQSSSPAVLVDQRICVEREVTCVARGRKMVPDPFHDGFRMHTPNIIDGSKRRITARDQSGQTTGNQLILNRLQPRRRLGVPFTLSCSKQSV
jgi:hypothetical protein